MEYLSYLNEWELFNKYKLKYQETSVRGLRCELCKEVLVNAYQNLCGCIYCFHCIECHLRKGNYFCTGSTADCINQKIETSSVFFDQAVNKKLLNLKVRCTIDKCQKVCRLRKFSNHIHQVHLNIVKREEGLQSNSIQMNDCQVYLNEYDDSKNDDELDATVEIVKQRVSESTNRVIYKVNDLESQRKIMEKNHTNQEKQLTNLIHKQNKNQLEIERCKSEIQRDIDALLNFYKKSSGQCQEKIDRDIPKLNKSTRMVFNSYTEQDLIDNITYEKQSINSLKRKMLEHPDRLTKRRQVEKMMSIDELPKIHICPFTWKLEKFSSRFDIARRNEITFYFSEPFYSHNNGYKMRLQLYPYGYDHGLGSHLSVFIQVMKGEYDDDLIWPMKYVIGISLVNSRSGKLFFTKKFDYHTCSTVQRFGFHKPIYDTTRNIGDSQFLGLSSIFSDSGILSEDSIVLRCTVESSL